MSIARVVILVLSLVIALSSAHAQEAQPADPPPETETEADAEALEEAVADAIDEVEEAEAADAIEEAVEAVEAAITDAAAEAVEAAEDAEIRREIQAPLMREGSRVNNVRGRVVRNPTTGLWQFKIPSPTGGPAQVLNLMPSRLLEELEATVAAAPDRTPWFLVTGQVYTFRQQNYMLLLHPAQLVGQSIAATRPPTRTVTTDEGERAEDIIRELEREVGPVVPRPPPSRRRRSPRDRRARTSSSDGARSAAHALAHTCSCSTQTASVSPTRR